MISQDVTLGGWELKQPEAQSSMMNKILLADNQELFRIGMAKILASEEDFRLAAQCADLERLLLSLLALSGTLLSLLFGAPVANRV
jgi:DNA-binding NarL/FixJ family response regulator